MVKKGGNDQLNIYKILEKAIEKHNIRVFTENDKIELSYIDGINNFYNNNKLSNLSEYTFITDEYLDMLDLMYSFRKLEVSDDDRKKMETLLPQINRYIYNKKNNINTNTTAPAMNYDFQNSFGKINNNANVDLDKYPFEGEISKLVNFYTGNDDNLKGLMITTNAKELDNFDLTEEETNAFLNILFNYADNSLDFFKENRDIANKVLSFMRDNNDKYGDIIKTIEDLLNQTNSRNTNKKSPLGFGSSAQRGGFEPFVIGTICVFACMALWTTKIGKNQVLIQPILSPLAMIYDGVVSLKEYLSDGNYVKFRNADRANLQKANFYIHNSSKSYDGPEDVKRLVFLETWFQKEKKIHEDELISFSEKLKDENEDEDENEVKKENKKEKKKIIEIADKIKNNKYDSRKYPVIDRYKSGRIKIRDLSDHQFYDNINYSGKFEEYFNKEAKNNKVYKDYLVKMGVVEKKGIFKTFTTWVGDRINDMAIVAVGGKKYKNKIFLLGRMRNIITINRKKYINIKGVKTPLKEAKTLDKKYIKEKKQSKKTKK